jgi:hypothetical protein
MSEGSLWHFVEIDRFELPSAPTDLSKHNRSGRFWWSGHSNRELEAARQTPSEGLPETLLQRFQVCPEPAAALPALEQALAGYLQRQPSDLRPVVLIGAPRSSNAEILEHWADDHGWRVIEPPGVERILNRDQAWLEQFDAQASPWVLPRLERCYLRHPQALLLIQRLLQRLAQGRAGRGVIGCDSWAWAYLGHIPPGTSHIPMRLTAQAFDRESLIPWLRPERSGEDPSISVSESGSDRPILTASDSADHSEPDETSSFLSHLAAYSRGIPEVAQAIWLRALQQNGELETRESENESEAETPGRCNIRLPAWRRLTLPEAPQDARDQAIVLHTLLLHNGLTAELLPRLLPLSESELADSLHRLNDAGLVEALEQSWRISAAGYPVVRKLLDNEGYLTDELTG